MVDDLIAEAQRELAFDFTVNEAWYRIDFVQLTELRAAAARYAKVVRLINAPEKIKLVA